MSYCIYPYAGNELNGFGSNAEYRQTDVQNIFNTLPDQPIYTRAGDDYKGGSESGWLERDNLLSPDEARKHGDSGGNVGIRLGMWFDGDIYVSFDIEEIGILPEDVRSIIDAHAVLTWDSPHTGRNRLVRIQDKTAYDLLRSYPPEVNDVTHTDLDDLEIWTDGHAMIPPSSIDHRHCSDNKKKRGCPGMGKDRYVLQSFNDEAPPLSYATVERLGDLLDLEPEESKPNDPTEVTEAPDSSGVMNSILIRKEFNENVPNVKHSFTDRKEYMLYGDWDGQEEFIKLWDGNFEDMTGSNVQGRAECKIANTIGFYFGRNKKIIRYFMEDLDFDTHYSKYPDHRETLLGWATSVEWCYCKGVSFETKLLVALQLRTEEETTVKQLAEKVGRSDENIRNALDILKAEGVADVYAEGRKRIWKDEGIAEGYLTDLDSVVKEHEDTEEEESRRGQSSTTVDRRYIN